MLDDEFNDDLVCGIKNLRSIKDLTQEEFARELGVSTSYVVRWENKQVKISYQNLKLICKTFNCTIDYLLNMEEYKNREINASDIAYDHVFGIEFPFIDENENKLLVLNLTTNKYILEFFYYKKLLDKQKEQNQINNTEYDFELKKLRDKYLVAFTPQLEKKVTYNCTMIGED